MADKNPAKIAGIPTRDFKDAGTEQRFTKDKPFDFEAGAFANYEAAGLVVKKGAEKPSA